MAISSCKGSSARREQIASGYSFFKAFTARRARSFFVIDNSLLSETGPPERGQADRLVCFDFIILYSPKSANPISCKFSLLLSSKIGL